ncbi:hypothetical protein WA026_018991 [Henosepilachna vigintioctopunctata]|uniref:60S ribosomal export protein NMD3 n=1 Tax=Henosepilachna vigintioctopunctata TaxID=420089 RepID=A0AAW1VHC8_9CUCU
MVNYYLNAITKKSLVNAECGILIKPNPSSVDCFLTHVDITEGIAKQGVLYFWRGCERYLQPPAEWIRAELESMELLALCLKKQKGLNRVKLIDAFLYGRNLTLKE